jgi:ParB family chromosome partitioning protein
MAPTFHFVPVSDIAPELNTYSVTYRPQMDALQRSVTRAGVLTPLHLRRHTASARLQVVCGTKRLQACQDAGYRRVPALIHEAAELSEEQAFLLAVHDNLGCRRLNVVEKARVVCRLWEDFHYSIATLLDVWCPLLDLPPRRSTLEAYGEFVRLDDVLQAATIDDALSVETALWIGRHEAVDRQVLVALFTGLKLSNNRVREFAGLIDEICQRDACSAAVLLNSLQIPALLVDSPLSGPQKIEHIRRVLRQVRYPRFSAHEQRVQETIRRLRLPSQISLRPPPYFEGQQYQVAFSVGTRQELQQVAQRLLEAAANPALDDLFAL